MSKDAAYRTVARHIFVAHQIASKDRRLLIILADGLEEAERKAKARFGVSAVHVKSFQLRMYRFIKFKTLNWQNERLRVILESLNYRIHFYQSLDISCWQSTIASK